MSLFWSLKFSWTWWHISSLVIPFFFEGFSFKDGDHQDSLLKSMSNSTNIFAKAFVSAVEEGTATHSNIPAWRIPVDRGAWWAADHGVAKSQTQLSDQAHTRCLYCWHFYHSYALI